MLDLWLLKSGEKKINKDGSFENAPDGDPDLSIDIASFHWMMEVGMKKVADEINFGFFEDSLVTPKSSERLALTLEQMDAELNPSKAETDCRRMARLFRRAVESDSDVAAICD